MNIIHRSKWQLRLIALSLGLCLTLVSGLVWSSLPPAQAQINSTEMRGVWLTSNDSAVLQDQTRLRQALDQLASMKLNRLYPVVWNAGYALFPSQVAQRAGIQPFVFRGRQGQDPLADLISEAHRRGMQVIPWFEFGFKAPPTSELANTYPQWLAQQRNGSTTSTTAAGEVVWLNPFRPEVQKLITDLVIELISNYDVDGIQFDDHMSLPSQFGYDPFTTALYRKETKKAPHPDFQNPDWLRWRANKLTAFMAQLSKEIKARKPQILVSLSPAPYDFAYRATMQDWVSWVRQNLIDELIVQVYRYDLQSFINQLNRPEILEAQQKIPTGVGVLTGLRTRAVPMSLIAASVQAAQARGLGVVFFYYETLWGYAPEPAPERIAALQSLFR